MPAWQLTPGLALDQIHRFAVDRAPDSGRWRHAVAGVDDRGRVRLPADIRLLWPPPAELSAVSHDRILVVRPDGAGSPLRVDERGRLGLPLWLRHESSPTGAVLMTWPSGDPDRLLLLPSSELDALVDAVVGEVG